MGRNLSLSRPAFWILCGLLGATATQAFSAAPRGMNQQGLLVDTVGQPLNGSVDLSVRIWADATSTLPGDLVYFEDHLATAVIDGVYSIEIGTGSSASGPFSATLFAVPDRWLELVVNTEVMAPRQRLLSVAYALQAQVCADAETLGGLTSANIIDTAQSSISFSNLTGLIADEQVPASFTRDAEVMEIVAASDGAGSGVDADLLDGLSSEAFISPLGPTIEGAEITDLSIGTADIAPFAVTAEKLADGIGSGVDADLLDGLDSTSFLRSNVSSTFTGAVLTFSSSSSVDLNGAVRVGQDSSADDDAILFDAGAESMTWNNAATRFEISDELRAGSFALTTPSTRNLRIPGNAFVTDPADEGWHASDDGYGFIMSVPFNVDPMHAVTLPASATITGLTCSLYRSSAPHSINGSARLLSRSGSSTSVTNHVEVPLNPGGVSTSIQDVTSNTITSPTVSDSSYYWISVHFVAIDAGDFARFYGCSVEYQLTTLEPS